jgi:hypothetical protein
MSRQAYRLERQMPAILEGVEQWLGSFRAALVVWEMGAKQAEFGHLVVAGYRQGRSSAIASLVRTLFEGATLLSWMAIPNDPAKQAPRELQVLLQYYRRRRARARPYRRTPSNSSRPRRVQPRATRHRSLGL